MEKMFKRISESKVMVGTVMYDANLTKKVSITNPDTGNKITSIQIGEMTYYPVSIVKEKKTKEKMATVS